MTLLTTQTSSKDLIQHYAEVRRRLWSAPSPKQTLSIRRWSWAPAPLPRKPIIDEATIAASVVTPGWRAIVNEVARKHGIEPKVIVGLSRSKPVIAARHEAIYRIVTELGMSFPAIGAHFKRDHTTIMHSYRIYKKRLARGDVRDVIVVAKPTGNSVRDLCHQVVVQVGMAHGITPAQIYGTQRRQDVFEARREVFLRLYRDHGLSFSQIGRHVGDKDHATVINAIGHLVSAREAVAA